ncbi:MAG: QueT transporter family protein [Clostridia bacterium]|nr:QueT transporter family protein [Clostridia bacterium]
MRSKNLKRLTRSALIAALYFILSISVPAITFGTIQFRISEALCVLPALFPEAILGLSIGCLLTNLFSPFGILDVILGTSATLIAAILTYLLHNKLVLAAIPPVIINALIVPLIWVINKTDMLYWLNMFSILVSQAVIVGALGIPLALGLRKAMPNEIIPKGFSIIHRKKYLNDDL